MTRPVKKLPRMNVWPADFHPRRWLTDEEAGQAACAQADPDAWFPERGGSTQEPKRLCATCPIRLACLTVGLTRREPHGIYGGTTVKERTSMLKRASSDSIGLASDSIGLASERSSLVAGGC
ncbi:transcription factor WhiB [Xylanimonas cellulosilytica DSM 15894]|uniref:Transcriptional regulator WhiB n=1 Tax=Xylanimonas cellulosilytica (strain DSM 15894 / JCM 12276 / CECT 5975 / KCTC 9989 / LMG 20990 / NBRC 107835 / XIL07) TaxID=446471 RepID=D1BWM3_XYLCX|nr:WhiB family transcriptional regulator [Xylanimonas cellulosilytica]ACZ29605.1 transcription factor WhiB [Xylanimonas cellulosilytica DSM 15894]